MKKYLTILLLALAAAAQAVVHDGTTCERAIEITREQQILIPGPGEYWYSAWTYDLPMSVTFTTQVLGNASLCIAPRVEVDFTCTGIYDDPRLTELFDKASGSYVDMPYVLRCDSQVLDNGNIKIYTLNVGENFRTLLVQAGITRNLKAYVHVTAHSMGSVKVKPDTVSGACLRSSTMISLGDTLHIAANDSASTFTLPLSGWKNDSIRFRWLGQQHPLHADLTIQHCDFSSADPTAIKEQFDIDVMDEHKYTAEQVTDLVERETFGGNVYYAHFLSAEAADLIVEKVPTVPGAGGAKTLRLGRATQLPLGDTTVYCFYKTWTGTTFTAPTENIFRMYIGTTPAIDTADASSYIASYQFMRDAYGTHRWDITNPEMRALTAQAVDNYLYVRFFCAAATSIIPSTLDDDCANGSKSTFVSGQSVAIGKKTGSSAYYRLFLPEWRGMDIQFRWAGAQAAMKFYIADTCMFATNTSAPRLVGYAQVNAKGTYTLPASNFETYISLEKIADPTGYLYMRVDANENANLTLTAIGKQPEQEPEAPAFERQNVDIQCETQANGRTAYVVRVLRPEELTLTTGGGMVVATWTQEPKDTHTLSTALPAGTYILTAASAPTRPIRIEIE